MTLLAQWVDVAQRVQQARTHVRELRNALLIDPVVPTAYVSDCARIASELKNVEQEISYLYETLLQAQAAIEYTGDWAEKGKTYAG